MALTLKTPGVYIEEKSAFPNAVVGVDTAVPAFVGYTEIADFKGQSLLNKPVRIESLKQYEQMFGKGPQTKYDLNKLGDASGKKDEDAKANQEPDLKLDGEGYTIEVADNSNFLLYDSLKFFYQNGGGTCFIIAVGTYGNQTVAPDFNKAPFEKGIKRLEKETEPTMLVIPDAILLDDTNCYSLQQQMLMHCGEQQNRVAILDVYNGNQGLEDPTYNPINEFRNQVASDYLSYGAAYYPYVHTTITESNEITYKNLSDSGLTTVKDIINASVEKLNPGQQTTIQDFVSQMDESPKADAGEEEKTEDPKNKEKGKTSDNSKNLSAPPADPDTINSVLSIAIPNYKMVMDTILQKKNLLPPSGGIAGVYTSVDNQVGVWKAPANVAMNSVISPAVLIDHNQQQDLNAPILGKAICAIRPFVGLGNLVWGARTLDANSMDWRYVNVRRTMIMLEQSIKFACKAYVFEPNVKNTWVSVKAMISNFLTNMWKQGALAGAVPADAFSVQVGLGTTMTAEDILEGKMLVEIKVAISRPAEFIVITFEQEMQKS